MRLEPARSRLEFAYKGNYGWYDKSSDIDYAGHAVQAGTYLLPRELPRRDRLRAHPNGRGVRP